MTSDFFLVHFPNRIEMNYVIPWYIFDLAIDRILYFRKLNASLCCTLLAVTYSRKYDLPMVKSPINHKLLEIIS